MDMDDKLRSKDKKLFLNKSNHIKNLNNYVKSVYDTIKVVYKKFKFNIDTINDTNFMTKLNKYHKKLNESLIVMF